MLTGGEQEYCESTAFYFLEFDQHIAVFNFEGINRDFGGLIVRGLARFRVVLPAVPGANDLAVLNHSLTEGTALMKANIIQCGIVAIHVGYADFLASTGEFFGGVGGGEFGLRRQFSEWHTSKMIASRRFGLKSSDE